MFSWMPARDRTRKETVEQAFGAVLRELRHGRGISQERLGHDTGSGRTYISELERGLKGPSLKTIFRLARELDVEASEVVRRIERRMGSRS